MCIFLMITGDFERKKRDVEEWKEKSLVDASWQREVDQRFDEVCNYNYNFFVLQMIKKKQKNKKKSCATTNT